MHTAVQYCTEQYSGHLKCHSYDTQLMRLYRIIYVF